MKARMTFDTLAYANRLKSAGLAAKIAETQAEAKAEILTSLIEEVVVTKQELSGFATKQDLSNFATKQDLSNFATKQDLAHLATKEDLLVTEQKILAVKQETLAVKQETLAVKQELELRIDKLGTELTLRLGSLIIGSILGMTAFISYFRLIH